MKIGAYDTHPAADKWPMMEPDKLRDLRLSIEANGQRDPIVTVDGLILDGRNRLKACLELGIEPSFVAMEMTPQECIEYVNDKNGERNHLTPDALALSRRRLSHMRGLLDKVRRKRQSTMLNDDLADRVDEHPVLARAVERGALSLEEAAAVSSLTADEQTAVVDGLENPAPVKPHRDRQETEEVTWTLTQRDIAALKAALPVLEHRSAPELKHAAHVIRSRV